MERSKITESYKSFFGIEDVAELAVKDELMIDWAESIFKDSTPQIVINIGSLIGTVKTGRSIDRCAEKAIKGVLDAIEVKLK